MHMDIETVDTDGAIRETAAAAAGDTRAGFLAKAGLLGGGIIGSAALIDPSIAGAATKKSDIAILNYALTLEYLEAEFYAKAAESGMLKGKILELAKGFGDEEQEHVDALIAMVKKAGGKPADKPMAKVPLDSEMAILKLAATVENLGAAAYLGAAGMIESPEILAAALSIHSVEARHAAALNKKLGLNITPDGAFAKPATKDQVLAAVKPFLVA